MLAEWAGVFSAVVAVPALVVAIVALLAPSPRDVAEDLKDDPDYRRATAARLRGATAGTVCCDALAGGLAFLERRMGAPGSARALGISMLLAIVYAWAAFALP